MAETPRRMTLGNLENGQTLRAQFNPREVEVALQANFQKRATPGQSYEEQQYANTGNPTVDFTLTFDGEALGAPNLLEVEAFVFSLMYPPARPTSIATGAPPRVLFSWPRWIALVTTMPKFKQKTTRFRPEGLPSYQLYTVSLEVRSTRRVGHEEIRRSALRRA